MTRREKIDAQKVKHAWVLQQKTGKTRTAKEAAVQHLLVIHHTLKKFCRHYESQKMANVLQELRNLGTKQRALEDGNKIMKGENTALSSNNNNNDDDNKPRVGPDFCELYAKL